MTALEQAIADVAAEAWVAEVAIDAILAFRLSDRWPGERVVLVADLLGALDEAQKRGARVVSLVVDSIGGDDDAWYPLYDALRSFSETGGAVVAYIARRACSTAALFILGADFIVADPQAVIGVHGAYTLDGSTGDEGWETRCNFMATAVIWARTLVPPSQIHQWHARRPTPHEMAGELFDATRAKDLGYVDFVGNRDFARNVALQLACGAEISTERRTGRGARYPPAESCARREGQDLRQELEGSRPCTT